MTFPFWLSILPPAAARDLIRLPTAATFPKGEGLFGVLLNPFVDFKTHSFKVFFYFSVCKADYMQSKVFQVACARMVVQHCIMLAMLHTVHLDHQFSFTAIKIHNIPCELFLSSKLIRMPFQELIP